MGYIKDLIKREQFNPRLVGIVTNPFYFSRRALFLAMNELGKEVSGKLLDVGCGQKPYQPYLSVEEYVGLEFDTPQSRSFSKADVFYDGGVFPFRESEFDSVLANEVFEHVFNPPEFLKEVHRVLKPDGKFLLTVPFVWDEHEQPNDFARYTSFGLKHVLEQSGFEVIHQRKTVTDIRVLFQLLNEYVYKKTYVGNTTLRQLLNTILIGPLTILGVLLYWIFPSNEDLYLDNVVLARKVRHV